MRVTRFGSLAVLLALALSLTTVFVAVAAPKVPADFTFQQHKDSPGVVTFSHEKHVAAGLDKCNACHTKVFKMKKGSTEFSMAKMKAGEECGACHNGKTEVAGKKPFTVDDKANCEKCHKK